MSTGLLFDWKAGQEYKPYFPKDTHSFYALFFLTIGFILSSYFLIYEVGVAKQKRSLTKELTVAFPAALALGFGSFFLLMTSGIYL